MWYNKRIAVNDDAYSGDDNVKLVVGVKNVSIQSQISIMFLIVILPLFAASIFLLLSLRTMIHDRSMETAMSDADSIQYRIEDMIDSVENSVDLMTTNSEMTAFLSNEYTEASEYYTFYSTNINARYLRAAPQIGDIRIYTEREDFIYNSDYLFADSTVRNTQWYKDAYEYPESFLWETVRDADNDEYYLCCIKAIEYKERVLGVAIAMISNEWIERFLPSHDFEVVFSVNKGSVFYSTFYGVSSGQELRECTPEYPEIEAVNMRKNFDHGFWNFNGYTVVKNFYKENPFQIIMLIPQDYITDEINQISLVYGGYCGLMVILSMLIVVLFTSVFSRRIKQLSEKMHAVAGGDFDVEIYDNGKDEISALYQDLHQMIKSMQKLMADVYDAKLQNEAFKLYKVEAEFKALSSQINPHFLYNTLETIRMKAFCNNDKETAELVKKLGKFMRRCLEFKDGEVTLRSELEFTNSYLELQTARFGDRVKYAIYCEVSKDYMILPLIIQPLVENAFVHGVESVKSNGRIDIKVYYHEELVIIDVTDNGVGMSEEKLEEIREKLVRSDTSSGKSIGLTNVNKRIKMYHGEQYGMTINSELGNGTTIRVTLPRITVPKQLN